MPDLIGGGLSRVIGRVAPGVVDAVDVDSVLSRVDVDALMARVDVDAVVSRVDVNALMARVDVDALMARVDVDALLRRVDLAALAEQAEIGRLVTESSQHVAASTLDLARRQIVGIDAVIGRVVDRVLRRTPGTRPAGPGRLVPTGR